MVDQRISQVAHLQHGVISRRQLLAAGLSSSGIGARVKHLRLFPVVRGVFSLSPYVDAWGRRYAAVLTAGGTPPAVLGLPSLRATAIRFPAGAIGSPPTPSDLRTTATASPDGGARPAIATRANDDRLSASDGGPQANGRPSATRSLLYPDRIRVVLSHWSVLHLRGLIDRPPHREHVTIEGTGGRGPADVHVHRARTLQAADVEIVQGLPVTTSARAILDASLHASVRQSRRLIREAEYRELVGIGAMADVVRRNPFHPASPTVRKADPQTAESRLRQTPIEDRTAEIVDRLPIAPPKSQLAVVGRSGRTYRADFAWPDLRLIVEADGRTSHARTTSFQSDRDRDADLAAAGWLTLRFTSLQLDRPDRVAATILDTARTRAAID